MIAPLMIPSNEPYPPIAEVAIALSVALAILALVRLVAFLRSRMAAQGRRSSLLSILLLTITSVAFAVVALYTWRGDVVLNVCSGGISGLRNCTPLETPTP